MPNRYQDWLKQARGDLRHSQNAREDGDYDWACFAAQQAGEKAVKALIEFCGGEGWGHAINKLLEGIQTKFEIPHERMGDALELDKFYIPTRYPNGFAAGAPVDYYTPKDAESTYAAAERLIQFCESQISRSPKDSQ